MHNKLAIQLIDLLAINSKIWITYISIQNNLSGILLMVSNAKQEILDIREQMLDEELDKFLNGINTSNYRSKTDTWMGL